jgi:hypothetical protein
MSFDKLISKRSRLLGAIEVEVSSAEKPEEIHIHGLHGLQDSDPLKALEELADKMEKLELQSPCESTNSEASDDVVKAISEMQKQLERFQRQSAVLKRLLNKLH